MILYLNWNEIDDFLKTTVSIIRVVLSYILVYIFWVYESTEKFRRKIEISRLRSENELKILLESSEKRMWQCAPDVLEGLG